MVEVMHGPAGHAHTRPLITSVFLHNVKLREQNKIKLGKKGYSCIFSQSNMKLGPFPLSQAANWQEMMN